MLLINHLMKYAAMTDITFGPVEHFPAIKNSFSLTPRALIKRPGNGKCDPLTSLQD